ncbi:hypothetical protein JDV02_007043 [Purpureocillium takamizusanense]|uniref:J domain-containing protein n=1 Tax=Purpureocillium takamizusanense TaxID=2060973 RepID=A0A9Q8QJU3_9HYPO|nr:uncharacterized protein JDV02_007043 [Purpureocillium takamizusanense]UNI21010.1 hypothetical protein JDV02_007043 [Purpureocillium takamizusanense]
MMGFPVPAADGHQISPANLLTARHTHIHTYAHPPPLEREPALSRTSRLVHSFIHPSIIPRDASSSSPPPPQPASDLSQQASKQPPTTTTMATGPPPDYYAILGIQETANEQQIRDAYKRAALKTHPDRVATDSPDRPARTRKFQLVNDAYFTLSDASRRREYDAQRRLFPGSSSSSRRKQPGGGASSSSSYADPFADDDESAADEEIPPQGGGGNDTAGNAYSWAWNFFTGNGRQNQNQNQHRGNRQQTEDAQFEDVFEEMMRDEGMAEGDGSNAPTGKFWALLGGVSGGALGFIVANVPGLVAGAVAGNRLGAVRDAKGKSVYAVFLELPQDDRSRLLSQLAARVFSHAVGV